MPSNTLKTGDADNASLNTANDAINNKQRAMTERQPNVMDELNLGTGNQPNTLRESNNADKDKKDKGMRTLAVSV